MIHKPKLIIVTGRPGSGKTTLSKELGRLLYLPVVSRDEIKEGYVNTFGIKHDKLPEDTNKIATEIFFKNLSFLLENKVSVIAEAAFQHSVWESQIQKLQKHAKVTIVICEVNDDVAAKRHLERGISDSKREFFHGDNRVSHYKKTGVVLAAAKYEAPSLSIPTIKVSTLDGYDPKLEKIIEKIAL